jgi:hypothetical protein
VQGRHVPWPAGYRGSQSLGRGWQGRQALGKRVSRDAIPWARMVRTARALRHGFQGAKSFGQDARADSSCAGLVRAARALTGGNAAKVAEAPARAKARKAWVKGAALERPCEVTLRSNV